jgi:hypothetical protein
MANCSFNDEQRRDSHWMFGNQRQKHHDQPQNLGNFVPFDKAKHLRVHEPSITQPRKPDTSKIQIYLPENSENRYFIKLGSWFAIRNFHKIYSRRLKSKHNYIIYQTMVTANNYMFRPLTGHYQVVHTVKGVGGCKIYNGTSLDDCLTVHHSIT